MRCFDALDRSMLTVLPLQCLWHGRLNGAKRTLALASVSVRVRVYEQFKIGPPPSVRLGRGAAASTGHI